MDGWMDGLMDGWMDGWMDDVWMGGWMDGWMNIWSTDQTICDSYSRLFARKSVVFFHHSIHHRESTSPISIDINPCQPISINFFKSQISD